MIKYILHALNQLKKMKKYLYHMEMIGGKIEKIE
jgi:hypothetical protein